MLTTFPRFISSHGLVAVLAPTLLVLVLRGMRQRKDRTRAHECARHASRGERHYASSLVGVTRFLYGVVGRGVVVKVPWPTLSLGPSQPRPTLLGVVSAVTLRRVPQSPQRPTRSIV